MILVGIALAGLSEARPYGPVRAVDVQATVLLPVPADLLAWDDRIWRLERERILVHHRDGRLERLPLTDAVLWLGPPGFPNTHRRGEPDPVLVLRQHGREHTWDVRTAKLEPMRCGGEIAPYGWSPDCRELRHGDVRLLPAKYSRLAVSGDCLWVFGAGQVRVFAGSERQPHIPGPIVHLSHDDRRVYVGVPTGVRAVDGATGEALWSLNRLAHWVAPSPAGDLVALQTEDTLLLADGSGALVYVLDLEAEVRFAWTGGGDLVGVSAEAVVRFDIGSGPGTPGDAVERLPEGLVQPGTVTLRLDGAPDDVRDIAVDGVGGAVADTPIRVGPVDRAALQRPASLDVVVHRASGDETVRVLRPEPGSTAEIALRWAPLEVALQDCSGACTLSLGPVLVGSEARVDRDGTRSDGSPAHWGMRAVFLGEPWSVPPEGVSGASR